LDWQGYNELTGMNNHIKLRASIIYINECE